MNVALHIFEIFFSFDLFYTYSQSFVVNRFRHFQPLLLYLKKNNHPAPKATKTTPVDEISALLSFDYTERSATTASGFHVIMNNKLLTLTHTNIVSYALACRMNSTE